MTQADVVVVGGGGAGLSAAIAAAESGARVVLVEKAARLGGTTALSVGSFSAAGTRLQSRRGIRDSPEAFAAEMAIANGELEQHENPELRALLAREAAVTFEGLRRLGLQFFGPTPEPPFTNPRMHNIVPHSGAYIAALAARARRLGVDILLSTRVEKLAVKGGRVVGADGPAPVAAARGVVLATGDYSASPELKAAWMSDAAARLPAINPNSTGDGFHMALALGAATRNTWRGLEELRLRRPGGADRLRSLPTAPPAAWAMRTAIERLPRRVLGWFARSALTSWVAPSTALFSHGAIAVNADGDRFANELAPLAHPLARQGQNTCFIVFDGATARRFNGWPNPISTFPGIAYAYLDDYERFRPDAVHSAGTLAALAGRIGVDGARLERAAATLRAQREGSEADEFGRPPAEHGLKRPPYHALGPLSAFVTLTDGGLEVTPSCQVVDVDGGVIPGLYAAGSTGQGGLILKNHGLHIAWAMTSGGIAGAQAARADAAR